MEPVVNFKDQLHADVAAVFLNTGEFAVTVVIGGIQVPGIWSDVQERYTDYHHDNLPRLPLDANERILEIAEAVIEVQPEQEVEVDGVVWIVRKVEPWDGLTRLTLYRNVGF